MNSHTNNVQHLYRSAPNMAVAQLLTAILIGWFRCRKRSHVTLYNSYQTSLTRNVSYIGTVSFSTPFDECCRNFFLFFLSLSPFLSSYRLPFLSLLSAISSSLISLIAPAEAYKIRKLLLVSHIDPPAFLPLQFHSRCIKSIAFTLGSNRTLSGINVANGIDASVFLYFSLSPLILCAALCVGIFMAASIAHKHTVCQLHFLCIAGNEKNCDWIVFCGAVKDIIYLCGGK